MGRWLLALGLICVPSPALAAAETAASPVSILLILALLSILPFVLVMITSFVKIAVVLSILRNAIGTPQVPPAMVITGLSVILTIYVMAPTGRAVYAAIDSTPQKAAGLFSGRSAADLLAAGAAAKEPVRGFLIKHSQSKDRAMFRDLARRMSPVAERAAISDRDLMVVVPAFVIGQLSSAFRLGFLIFVPFLIIDLVVANVLLALGMHMLSPTTISLPFKLLLFVLVDGWALLAQGLVLSYA
ncbi:MAG: type III secretion system export apparatus subunit SctR [Deltaproteobacteria bacterium]|nr:type III secretion system export apparatus subunit SctR [Deltaproteobacteria bacterium]